MLIPYKVKNPPRHFPYATVAIIALNVLVYMATSDRGVVIRREVVNGWALVWGQSAFLTIFTSMFLHGDPFHLAGNMLFLWVFGPAVEDRLRPGLYVAMYLFTGFAGAVAHAALSAAGAIGAYIPLLGASGCVMGVMGAYWYLYSWSPVCIFYWYFIYLMGTCEVRAFWVIGAYFVLDLLNGILARHYSAVGGVANFAHVGGAFAGALLVWALRLQRDTSEVSQVKAVQSDYGGDTSLLQCDDLAKLVAAHPDDRELAVRYAKRAWESAEADHFRAALMLAARDVILACPDAVIDHLMLHNGAPDALTTGDLLYLASYCESQLRPDRAIRIYEILENSHPDSHDLEQALYRSAVVYARMLARPREARAKLEKLLAAFPNGPLLFGAEDLLTSLPDEQYGAAA